MPFACPRTCGRLTTGAIFISLGVVQLTAAVILLKSKYVYLLSAPNIWTAISNIAVGGLLGLSAGVWKSTSKNSSKHAVRRNILAALMTSAILLNTTTAILLIMGEGNTLLSIHLENNGINSATLVSEILAYAYAASVCSPVLCVVVAIIFLAGMCFPNGKKSFDMKSAFESDSGTFNWVYKTERHGLPLPDPEIVRKALSSKSFIESDDSCSSISTDLLTSQKRISRIENQFGNTFPHLNHQRSGFSENCPHTISRSGNRVSFADDPSINERTILNYSHAKLEGGSVELHSPPKLQSKKRGDLSAVRYASRTICQNEECQKIESSRTPNPLVISTNVADTSVISERDDIPPLYTRVLDETRYSSPEAKNFVKNLSGFEHEHLRRTSTKANPNYVTGMLDQEYSQGDFSFKSPVEYHNHTIHKVASGGNSNVGELNRELHDQEDQMMDSRTEDFFGEVVPIRINTVPRKKLSSKLIPVPIPVVSDIKIKHQPKLKEYKLDDAETKDLQSFRVGHQMKSRSKSAGSHSAKHSEYFAVSTPKASDSEVPLDETALQLSPAHTSGYISAFEDTLESSSHDPSTVNSTTISNSSAFAGMGSSSSHTARKKFRSAHRKILEGGRTLSETDVINDMMQKICENPQLSNKESATELFLDLLFQTIDYQSTKRTKNDSL